MMNELQVFAARTETERLLVGMVECEKIETAKFKAQRDHAVALLRQIYGVLTSDDVTLNCRTKSAALRLADWVGQSDIFVEDPFKTKKNFSARVTEVGNV